MKIKEVLENYVYSPNLNPNTERPGKRKSIRLKGYDYTRVGGYFITICTRNPDLLFGEIVHGEMVLNTIGNIIDFHWRRLPQHFKHIKLYEFQIMPNHFHGILWIVGAKHSESKNMIKQSNILRNASPLQAQHLRPKGTTPGSLGAIMQNYQSVTTRKINKIRKTSGATIWQRNYYEHIIRNEWDFWRIQQYIIENPLKWEQDKYFNQ